MKLRQVRAQAPESIALAVRAGVALGSGSDILGGHQTGRGGELPLKAQALGPMGAIVSATQVNARLFNMENRIGAVKEGMDADLIAVAGDPLGDMSLLSDGGNVRLVIKGGKIFKDTM